MMYAAMFDELTKFAEGEVSTSEAVTALKRLRELEARKPTAGQVARGAVAGSVGGMAASLARGAVSGKLREGVGEALQAPTVGGKLKALGKGALKGAGEAAAGSAAFGATVPFVRQYLDTGAEKAKLKEYLGTSKRGRVRG